MFTSKIDHVIPSLTPFAETNTKQEEHHQLPPVEIIPTDHWTAQAKVIIVQRQGQQALKRGHYVECREVIHIEVERRTSNVERGMPIPVDAPIEVVKDSMPAQQE